MTSSRQNLHKICRYRLRGNCRFDDLCRYSHDVLQNDNLRPQISNNADEVVGHANRYSRPMTGANATEEMKLSFAIAKSQDKMCGICLETVVKKRGRECRFGILPKCKHIFCLTCIRRWRQAEYIEDNVKRGCPECRVFSEFVCPSAYWVDTKEEKDKLLSEYRAAMGAKDCKYFNGGLGKCPFGNKCFYRHHRRCDDNQTQSNAVNSD